MKYATSVERLAADRVLDAPTLLGVFDGMNGNGDTAITRAPAPTSTHGR